VAIGQPLHRHLQPVERDVASSSSRRAAATSAVNFFLKPQSLSAPWHPACLAVLRGAAHLLLAAQNFRFMCHFSKNRAVPA
jgi:hypothetical protein